MSIKCLYRYLLCLFLYCEEECAASDNRNPGRIDSTYECGEEREAYIQLSQHFNGNETLVIHKGMTSHVSKIKLNLLDTHEFDNISSIVCTVQLSKNKINDNGTQINVDKRLDENNRSGNQGRESYRYKVGSNRTFKCNTNENNTNMFWIQVNAKNIVTLLNSTYDIRSVETLIYTKSLTEADDGSKMVCMRYTCNNNYKTATCERHILEEIDLYVETNRGSSQYGKIKVLMSIAGLLLIFVVLVAVMCYWKWKDKHKDDTEPRVQYVEVEFSERPSKRHELQSKADDIIYSEVSGAIYPGSANEIFEDSHTYATITKASSKT